MQPARVHCRAGRRSRRSPPSSRAATSSDLALVPEDAQHRGLGRRRRRRGLGSVMAVLIWSLIGCSPLEGGADADQEADAAGEDAEPMPTRMKTGVVPADVVDEQADDRCRRRQRRRGGRRGPMRSPEPRQAASSERSSTIHPCRFHWQAGRRRRRNAAAPGAPRGHVRRLRETTTAAQAGELGGSSSGGSAESRSSCVGGRSLVRGRVSSACEN